MKSIITILGLVALVAVVVIIGPLLTIWAFNTLFPTVAVPYDFYTWLAVIILGAFFRANVSVKKNS
jgi:hypothetical protein